MYGELTDSGVKQATLPGDCLLQVFGHVVKFADQCANMCGQETGSVLFLRSRRDESQGLGEAKSKPLPLERFFPLRSEALT